MLRGKWWGSWWGRSGGLDPTLYELWRGTECFSVRRCIQASTSDDRDPFDTDRCKHEEALRCPLETLKALEVFPRGRSYRGIRRLRRLAAWRTAGRDRRSGFRTGGQPR